MSRMSQKQSRSLSPKHRHLVAMKTAQYLIVKANMNHTPVPQNFIYPEIKKTDYIFGSGQIDAPILREDGDFRDFVPGEDEQRKNGVESSECFVKAQQNDVATLQEEKYGLLNSAYAGRFNALLGGGTPNGGSPLAAAESFRNNGLINETMLPFDENITSWGDFHSWKGGNEDLCRKAGKLWLTRWNPQYHIVFQKEQPIASKYVLLAEALKYGPVAVSMSAWFEQDGIYIKPEGMTDNHLTLAVFMDAEGYIYVWDSYSPFLKKIAPNTNFDFAMQWSIDKKEEVKELSIFARIVEWFKRLFNRDYAMFGAARSPGWPEARNKHLAANPNCVICGHHDKKQINVHHKKPFHLFPALELDPTNFVTLCESAGMNCHITFGHLGNFKSYNMSIDEDLKVWSEKVKSRP